MTSTQQNGTLGPREEYSEQEPLLLPAGSAAQSGQSGLLILIGPALLAGYVARTPSVPQSPIDVRVELSSRHSILLFSQRAIHDWVCVILASSFLCF
jgi:hypothetical protein